MPTLVRLPACSPTGVFDIVDPGQVASMTSDAGATRTLVRLRSDSEEGGYWIALTQEEVARRLGITVVDSMEQAP